MAYHATQQRVHSRGVPPDNFLDELVAWNRTAPDDIFLPNSQREVYSNVVGVLGPWQDLRHRRAVLLEVMRVLAGFESSWKMNEGVDATNPTSMTPNTMEARRLASQCKLDGLWAGTQAIRAQRGWLIERERLPAGHEAGSSAGDGICRLLTAPYC